MTLFSIEISFNLFSRQRLTVCVTRAGAGDGEAVRLEKCWGVGKCLEMPPNPQRRVHALLGSLPAYQSDCWKKKPPPTRPTFTHNLFFSNGKKQNLPKCKITKSDSQLKRLLKKWTSPNKTTNEPDWKLWKTWLWQRIDKANEADAILQTQLIRTFAEKDKPILKTYKANLEQNRSRETKPIKTTADRTASQEPCSQF